MTDGWDTPSSSKTVFSSFKSPRPAPSPPHGGALTPMTSVPSNISIEKGTSNPGLTSNGISLDHPVFSPPESNNVKAGYVGFQREKLRNLIWTRNLWMVLRYGVLCMSQKEHSQILYYLSLNEVHQIERVAARRFCLCIMSSSQVWYLMFENDRNLEDWLRVIHARCPLLHIGYPTDFNHDLHVTYDQAAGEITGLPETWIQTLSTWGVRPDFTADTMENSPLSAESATSGLTSSSSSAYYKTASSMRSATPSASASLPITPPSLGRPQRVSVTLPRGAPSVVTSVDQFRRSPHRYRDLDARNLTGSVKTLHLLPTTRDDNCDIWKAEWTGSFGTRKVAVQVIRVPDIISEEDASKLTDITISEMRVLHQLRHPNVVRIRGFVQDQGPVPAIVSAWFSRGNLMDYLVYDNPNAGKAERLKFLTEAAAGLNYLHNFAQEILHGNFCGAHILLNDNGNACISGFGINPVLQELERPDTSDPTARTGPSPRWAAVEVICSERRHMSPSSDVFSFARTVVEVMTGKLPYYYITDDEEVIPTVLKGILPRRPPIFGEDTLWHFLERCWREDFTKRPSMALMLLRLEETLSLYPQSSSLQDPYAGVMAPKSKSKTM